MNCPLVAHYFLYVQVTEQVWNTCISSYTFCRKWKRKAQRTQRRPSIKSLFSGSPHLAIISTMAAVRWFIQSCRSDECGPFLGQWTECHTATLNREQRGEATAVKLHTLNTHCNYTVNPTFKCWYTLYILHQEAAVWSTVNVSTLQSFTFFPAHDMCIR